MARQLGLLLVLVVVLLIRVGLYFQHQPDVPDGSRVRFSSSLLRDPSLSGFSQGFWLSAPEGQRIYVTTERFPEYHYGQRLDVEGVVEVFERENGSVGYAMSYPEIAVVSEYGNFLYYITYAFRERISSVFSRYLDYPYSALLMGIVFGVREGMPEDLTDAFVKTGVIHITAASGMNVTMLAGAICAVFAGIFNRRAVVVLAVVSIWFYAGVAGFDASITRASLMATIAFGAALLGRQNTGWYALVLTGFVMMLISPNIIYDVGFQLSFFSTAGIILLTPLMLGATKTVKSDPSWFLKDDFKTTLSAQIATIPILFINFSEYSVFSVVINLLILWTIPPLMVLGGIASIFSLILPVLSVPLLYLALPLLWYLVTLTEAAAGVIPTLRVEGLGAFFAVVYYFLLGVIVFRIKAKSK